MALPGWKQFANGSWQSPEPYTHTTYWTNDGGFSYGMLKDFAPNWKQASGQSGQSANGWRAACYDHWPAVTGGRRASSSLLNGAWASSTRALSRRPPDAAGPGTLPPVQFGSTPEAARENYLLLMRPGSLIQDSVSVFANLGETFFNNNSASKTNFHKFGLVRAAGAAAAPCRPPACRCCGRVVRKGQP